MDAKVFVLAIIVLVFGFGLIDRRLKAQLAERKQRQAEANDGTRAEIDELKKRVETLERIATDKGTRLREEIDAL